jgi:signal transduction histidine kinase/CheY-like chemotaxis protein/streptogramin lyase
MVSVCLQWGSFNLFPMNFYSVNLRTARRSMRDISFRKIFCHSCIVPVFLVLIFMGIAPPATSQSVRSLSTKDGLPQSFVSGLEQDDSSFIWLGTRNGLTRYDGIEFRVFQHHSRDTTTPASNLIIWLRRDHQNNLWIEYETGEIDRMNPVTEKIDHYIKANAFSGEKIPFIRRGWLIDEDGIFWGILKGSGLIKYNPHTRHAETFNRAHGDLLSDTVRGIAENNLGVWLVNDREIGFLDRKTNQFHSHVLPFKQDFGVFAGSEAIAIDLHQRKNGELIWGDRQKLYFFNPASGTFRIIPVPALSYLGVRWIRTGPDGGEYFENYGQVYRYEEKTGLTTIGKTLKESLGDVKSFLIDRSGLIWLGTNAQGLHLIDQETPFFQSFVYRKDFSTDILRQELGIQLAETFNWNARDQQFSQPSYYLRSTYGPHKRYYLALKETVCFADSGQRSFTRLPVVPILDDSEKLRIGIRGISLLPDGSPLVIAYNGNMMWYNQGSFKWQPFIEPGLLRKRFGGALLPLNISTDHHYIWISTEENGLLRINIITKEIVQLKESQSAGALPANQLLGLVADPLNQDLLWIGSYQGLILLHKQSMTCNVFSLNEGLPDNTIYSIQPDSTGYLWLSTNKGICRFDPSTGKVRTFHTIDGLAGDEFNRFHHLTLPDGQLAFGGTEGWTIFNPLRIRNDNFEPSVALTDFKINNKDITPATERSPLKLPLNASQQITLSFDQNTLSFGFAGLEFSKPQNLQYRYRLVGFDNDWVMSGFSHQANYTKIPPGNYELLVNASNTTGKWSSNIKKIPIHIGPPWYATRMAYLCYFIIIAGLAWTFIRFRISRELMKQDILMKEKEALQLKELDDMKSRFFSNITHEFRTPLTLIMGPAEQLKSAQSKDVQQERLTDTILANAKQLLVLINRLMDLSRLEAGAFQLQEQRGGPGVLVGSVVLSFENDASSRQVNLFYQDQTGQAEGWFCADALERIVFNLISNALKFTPSGGKVETILSVEESMLLLIVKDNGIGIPENKIQFIFDRFYQAGENSSAADRESDQGSGIGLSLVKELITQLNGSVEVESNTGAGKLSSGTVFRINIPFRKTLEEQIGLTPYKADNSRNHDMPVPDSGALQILLVEDSGELAGFIRGILSPLYIVTHVENGAIGLETALSLMPDLIITDVMMPVMDGYELCSRLKADIRSSHIPVILLTAKVSQENLMEGLQKGADDYLTKPFHPSELLLRIRNLLERQRKLRDRIREELATQVPSLFEKPVPPQDIFLTRLYSMLDEHLDDALFGVDQMADEMHMSRSSLHRKLKALTDMSTTEVLRNYRLRKASFFLLEGFSSSDSAYKSGFGSPAYFTKSFRELYGITPGDYIKKHKTDS